MKKLFLSLAVVMSVSMFACGGNEANKADGADSDSCANKECCDSNKTEAPVDTTAADTATVADTTNVAE